jgi:bacillithiol biosynthesis deacetylase BshB1
LVGLADILAFAPHPDDVEIGAGGTLARHCRLGHEVVVCDLTLGELATNGGPETRAAESREAARLLGLAAREVLGLRDRELEPSPERMRVVAEAVRRWRPRVVLAPCADDRHPDHAAAARLVREAVFSAGLARFPAAGEPHRVARVLHYFVNARPQPSFVVDVSEVYEVKRAALAAYVTQFGPAASGLAGSRDDGHSGGRPETGPVATPLTEGYLEWVELRDRWYGSLAGVARAEGFLWDGTLTVADLTRHL